MYTLGYSKWYADIKNGSEDHGHKKDKAWQFLCTRYSQLSFTNTGLLEACS